MSDRLSLWIQLYMTLISLQPPLPASGPASDGSCTMDDRRNLRLGSDQFPCGRTTKENGRILSNSRQIPTTRQTERGRLVVSLWTQTVPKPLLSLRMKSFSHHRKAWIHSTNRISRISDRNPIQNTHAAGQKPRETKSRVDTSSPARSTSPEHNYSWMRWYRQESRGMLMEILIYGGGEELPTEWPHIISWWNA